jgi:UDP-2,3-diacylglucosamine hydrolase
MIDLNDGAIFIADAHYQVGVREEFYHFLVSIENSTIKTKEIIFMGDMFDLLVGSIEFTVDKNQRVIDMINRLSKTINIIYLEGNHDFDLQRLFENVKVVPLQNQPLVVKYHNQKIALVHGDNFGGFWYRVYSNFIRNPFILKILNIVDRSKDNFISKKILKEQEIKQICKKTKEFNKIAKQKLKFYDITTNRFDLICEGHYHINREYQDNKVRHRFFPSYACGMSYFKIDFAGKVVFNQLKG